MTTAEKNAAIKQNATEATIFPEGTIQVGDYKYAIPVEVDGETRWAVADFTAKSNKDTKTTSAFDPEVARAEWQDTVATKAAEKAAKAAERAANAAAKGGKSKAKDKAKEERKAEIRAAAEKVGVTIE